MPKLAEIVDTAWDTAHAGTASATPDSTSPSAAAATPVPDAADPTPGTPTDLTNPETTTPSPEAAVTLETAATATPPEARLSPAEQNSRALAAKTIAAHPELEAALNARIKELEKGYQKEVVQARERLAEERKQYAEQIVRDETAAKIPAPHLQSIAQVYHMATQGNATERQQAADYYAKMAEAARLDAQNTPADPYANLHPQVAAELREMRELRNQQTEQQRASQVAGEWAQLETELGIPSIPDDERAQVHEAMTARGLQSVQDIGMVWKGLFGWQHAEQEGIRKGHVIKQGKQGLAVNTSGAPPPASGETRPANLRDAVAGICDLAGIR